MTRIMYIGMGKCGKGDEKRRESEKRKDFFVRLPLSEVSTGHYAIRSGNPPGDWQSFPWAEEEPDSKPGLLYSSLLRYY